MKTVSVVGVLLMVIAVETLALWRMRNALVAATAEEPASVTITTASERERCLALHGNFYRYAYGYVVCERSQT